MNKIKQAFAEHFGYKSFESMDTSDQRAFEWCVENKKLFYNVAYNEGYEDGYKDANSENTNQLQPAGVS